MIIRPKGLYLFLYVTNTYGMHIIGIDPGANGGIAVLDYDGKCKLATVMPDSREEIVSIFRKYIKKDTSVYLEKVHAMPKQGVTSMFNFGESFGFLQGVIQSIGIQKGFNGLFLVTPQTWKNYVFGSIPKIAGESGQDRKKRLKYMSIEEAKALFPDVSLFPVRKKVGKVESDGIAEALLIAYYGRSQ